VRILKTVQSYYPFQEKGGTVVKVRALAQGLARRGHQVTVLTADLGISKYREQNNGHNNIAGQNGRNGDSPHIEPCSWGYRLEENGVAAIYLPSRAHYRALTWNPSVIGFSRNSLEAFDIVHCYGLYDLLGPIVARYCRHLEVPYVIEPMGMYRPIDRGFQLKMLWRSTVGHAFWSNAAQIIATSEMEEGELLEDGVSREKLAVRYNGIDIPSREKAAPRGSFRLKWRIPPEEPLILFLSRLIPRKGADILIEAFAQACPSVGRLVIAGPEGEPGYRAHLEKCASNSGVADRIIFTGAIYNDEKQALLSDATIFALPSRYENFANVAAEAMAAGVPVIISEFCGIRSIVEGQAGLVIPVDRDALTEALRKLLTDSQLYARFQEGCRRAAARLSWECLTEQMEGYYNQVLTARHGIH
jgi:glycosyltransferase involved in cell wall biosynthesis